jgi:hypothetical protein
MSRSEKIWILAAVAFAAGLIAWLNAAATVDWGPLGSAVGSGKAGPIAFAAGLAVYVIVMVAGIWISVAKAQSAFRRRIAGTNPA